MDWMASDSGFYFWQWQDTFHHNIQTGFGAQPKFYFVVEAFPKG
jgi:hypothetical protein